jgi:hypothetical protein
MKSKVVLRTYIVSGLALGLFLYQRRTRPKKSIEPAKQISTLTHDEIYLQKAKERFLDTFLQEEMMMKKKVNFNENIDARFYDVNEYKHAVLHEKNDLELSWKQRILIQATPRGNVIMFYDVYKHGFSYYADNSVPYSVLNAVAMKYVLLYRCRHFFLDEQIVPIGCNSPFVALYCKEQPSAKKEGSTNLGLPKKIDVKSGPFAKFAPKPQNNTIVANRREKMGWWGSWFLGLFGFWSKNNITKSSEKVVKPDTSIKPVLPVVEYVKNRMIYLGKCANFSMLLKPAIEAKKPIAVKQKQISYSSFKSWQNPAKI